MRWHQIPTIDSVCFFKSLSTTFGVSKPRKLPQFVKIKKEPVSAAQRISKVSLDSTDLVHRASNIFCIFYSKDIEIAASWRRRSPMRARSPVIKRLNHSVSVGADVGAWCPLSLRTDFEVAPPKALAIKTSACTHCTFRDEENFCFSSWRPGLLLRLSIPIAARPPPIVVRREWTHRLREHIKSKIFS
jgi:hypothetical protein